MSDSHFQNAGSFIGHRDASDLFPVGELTGKVYQHRDAQLRLTELDSEDIVVISPTSLASGYYLTQHPLTAIEIESLPQEVRSSISDQGNVYLNQFELIQVGRGPSQIENRSISEFTNLVL